MADLFGFKARLGKETIYIVCNDLAEKPLGC
jgi:hypothetical protein